MPKPKNEEIYNSIVINAHKLFLKSSYTGTSYQDIAESCGIKKALVQYYFPQKKELAILFFSKLLENIMEYIRENNLVWDNEFVKMLVIGQMHFQFLLKDEQNRAFMRDIIKSRELTEAILVFDFDWGMEFLGIEIDNNDERLQNDIIYAMGGFYEILYAMLKNKQDIDVEYYLKKVVIAIMENLGYTYEAAKKVLSDEDYSNIDFGEINEALCQAFDL